MNIFAENLYIPGTVIKRGKNADVEKFLDNVFFVSDGIMLSRIKEVSGVDGSTLQNWVKRGWIGNTVNKKYSKNQLARILIINMLRDALQLERIDYLLKYINGKINNEEDDIIPESQLYLYICRIINVLDSKPTVNEDELKILIRISLNDYNEKVTGAKDRLEKALLIIITAYCSSIVMGRANQLFLDIRKEA